MGSNKTTRVDVKIIAATNRILEKHEGRPIPSDLFYRLNLFPIELPPLRERRSDIPQLVHVFPWAPRKQARREIRLGSTGHMNLLMGYGWPGNIRELQDLINAQSSYRRANPMLSLASFREPRLFIRSWGRSTPRLRANPPNWRLTA